MAKEFFVAINGNDNNSGSIEKPLLTLKKAIELSRKSGESQNTIYLREGRYFIYETIEITKEDKGLTIASYNNEKVYLDGGVVINPVDVRDYKDEIKVIDLSLYDIKMGEYGSRGFRRNIVNSPNELFIDSEAYTVSRYPKEDIIMLTKDNLIDSGSVPAAKDFECRKPVIKYDTELLEKWKNEKDMYVAGYPNFPWADDCLKVTDIDVKSGNITLKHPHSLGYKADHMNAHFYFLNVFSELSKKGEYYADKENSKIYFIPKKDISDALIQVSVMDKVMFALEDAQNVTIKGITIENSRNSGIYIEGGEDCKVENCVFRNLGIIAIQFGQGAEPQPEGLHTHHGERKEGVPVPKPISREIGSWHEYIYEFPAWDNNAGKNHIVSKCHIYNMGAGGILLSGGNRKKLIPGGNTVYSCEIHAVNRLDKTYKSAVNIMGVGNVVSHCKIYNMPSFGLYIHGNDHVIEYNDISDVVMTNSDSGAIYMGKDMSEVGNIIRYNYFHHIRNTVYDGFGVCAIYFDDDSIYNMVYGNYFYDIKCSGQAQFSTIFHNGGGLTSIANNIFIDCLPALNPSTQGNSYDKMKNIPLYKARVHTTCEEDMHGVLITSEIWKNKYPYLYKTYTEDYNPGTKYWHNVIVNDAYNYCEDFKNGDLTFHNRMWAQPQFKITDDIFGLKNEYYPFKHVDFKEIGLVK